MKIIYLFWIENCGSLNKMVDRSTFSTSNLQKLRVIFILNLIMQKSLLMVIIYWIKQNVSPLLLITYNSKTRMKRPQLGKFHHFSLGFALSSHILAKHFILTSQNKVTSLRFLLSFLFSSGSTLRILGSTAGTGKVNMKTH